MEINYMADISSQTIDEIDVVAIHIHKTQNIIRQ